MTELKDFQIEDIDGCEFVRSSIVGKILISWHRDEDGCETGKIHVVYPDASQREIEQGEAQKRLDSGEWTVFRTEIEPQYITETCPICGGGGFSGQGTGYDDVCDCGGYGEIIVGVEPNRPKASETTE